MYFHDDFQHPLKGVQGGEQKWGTRCSEKNWQNRSSDRYFQEPILWAQFLYLLISRKALKSFMIYKSLLLLVASRNLQQICALSHTLPLNQNHKYIDPLPSSLEQFLRAIWDAVSQAVRLILPPIKFNSQLSHCIFFFSVDTTQPCFLPSLFQKG